MRNAPGPILPVLNARGLPAEFTDTETIADLVEHTSVEIPVDALIDKTVEIMAVEVVGAGVPGTLNCWIETSPFPTANNTMWPAPYPTATALPYWGAIGGGGGAFPPVAPILEVGTGVHGATHAIKLNWNVHSRWARLVIQTPVAAALPNAFWVVQAIFTGRG